MKLEDIKLNTPYWINNGIMYVIGKGTVAIDEAHVVALDHGTDPHNIPEHKQPRRWYQVEKVDREATKEDLAKQRKEWGLQYPGTRDVCTLNNCWCVKVQKEKP